MITYVHWKRSVNCTWRFFLQWNFKYITFSYCNTAVCTYVYFALKSYMWILITCLIENYLNLWNIIHFIMWFAWKIHGHFVWKKKTWTEKTFKQISNVELSFTNSNVYCINMFCLNDWNIFNSSNITNKEYKVFQTKYMYLDIMKAIKNTLYQRVSTIVLQQ